MNLAIQQPLSSSHAPASASASSAKNAQGGSAALNSNSLNAAATITAAQNNNNNNNNNPSTSSKSFANFRFNHTNGQLAPSAIGHSSFIVTSSNSFQKKSEGGARERKTSEGLSGADQKHLKALYKAVAAEQESEKIAPKILNRTHLWNHLLINSDYDYYYEEGTSAILSTPLDLENQIVIRQDARRTRSKVFDTKLQDDLERFLTYYCKQQDVKYKQGLNEVAAPFVYLTQHEGPSKVCIDQAYSYFINFLEKFVPNFFHDSEFNSMQCFFFAFTLLMKYHDPNLNHFLSRNDIQPEIYAYPWFITLFSSKAELDIIYNLWDLFLIENDQLLILYVSLALIKRSKKLIMSVDFAILPQTLANLRIESLSDLKEIYALALEIRKQTPISFASRISALNVLEKDYHKRPQAVEEMRQAAREISKYVAMPISPIEILHHLYPSVIQCPNPDCSKNTFLKRISSPPACFAAESVQTSKPPRIPAAASLWGHQSAFFKTFQGELEWPNESKEQLSMRPASECKYCSIKALIPSELSAYVRQNEFLREVIEISKRNSIKVYKDNQLDFKTFDLRSHLRHQGYLNKTTLVTMGRSFEQDTLDSLISDYIEYKNIAHFAFLVSDYQTTKHANTNNENTQQQQQQHQKQQQQQQQQQQHHIAIDSDEVYAVQKFSSDFIEYGFPYISIVEGGFKVCHDIILYQGLKLNDHSTDSCKYCLRHAINPNIHSSAATSSATSHGSSSLPLSASMMTSAHKKQQNNTIFDFFSNVFSSKESPAAANATTTTASASGGSSHMHQTHGIQSSAQQQGQLSAGMHSQFTTTAAFDSKHRTNSNEKQSQQQQQQQQQHLLSPAPKVPKHIVIDFRSIASANNHHSSAVAAGSTTSGNNSYSRDSSNTPVMTMSGRNSIIANSGFPNKESDREQYQQQQSSYHHQNNQFLAGAHDSLKSGKQLAEESNNNNNNNPSTMESDTISLSSTNRIVQEKSSRMNQVQASLSPPIKQKLMSKYQPSSIRTPMMNFTSMKRTQQQQQQQTPGEQSYSGGGSGISNDYRDKQKGLTSGGLLSHSSGSGSFVAATYGSQKAADANDRSLTIPNEDSFCDNDGADDDPRDGPTAMSAGGAAAAFNHPGGGGTIVGEFDDGYGGSSNSGAAGAATTSHNNQNNLYRNVKQTTTGFSENMITLISDPIIGSDSSIKEDTPSMGRLKMPQIRGNVKDEFYRSLDGPIKKQSQQQQQQQQQSQQTSSLSSQQMKAANLGKLFAKPHSQLSSTAGNSQQQQQQQQQHISAQQQQQQHSQSHQMKQNYFDIAKKQIGLKNFQMRGLFQTQKVKREVWDDFIQILLYKPFSFYECKALKDKHNEELRLFANTPNNFKSSPRILILSQEFVISLKVSAGLLQQLQSIKNGKASSMSMDRPSNSSGSTGAGNNNGNNFVSVKSFFFMRNLLRITSKKFDTNILSFYFQIPDVFKSSKFEATQYYRFIEKFDLVALKELVLSRRLNEILHETQQIISDDSEKFEIKRLYDMENEAQSADCIRKSKEYYTLWQSSSSSSSSSNNSNNPNNSQNHSGFQQQHK